MYKYRGEITKGEEIRYISHLDYAGVIERAIRRAKLPAAYSEGFNPHIKMAFASALSVGVTSDAEYMDIELTKELCQPEVFDKLSKALPPGVKLLRLKPVKEEKNAKKHKALMAEADEAIYEITLPVLGSEAEVKKALNAFMAEKEVIFHRRTPKKDKEIEVKQYILSPVKIDFCSGQARIIMDIAITQQGSIKPSELLKLFRDKYNMPIDDSRAIINRRALKGMGKALIDLV